MRKLFTIIITLLIAGTSIVAQTGDIVTMKSTLTSNCWVWVKYTGSGSITANGIALANGGSEANNITPTADSIIIITTTGSIQLKELALAYMKLTELNVSQAVYLTYLSCRHNLLTELDVTNNTELENMDCYYNKLAELDVKNNTKLKQLYFNNNQLKEMDVKNNTALTHLDCSFNQLKEFDIKSNTELIALNCQGNQLSSLDLRNNQKLSHLYAPKQAVEITVLEGAVTFENPIYYHNKAAVELAKINGTPAAYNAPVLMPADTSAPFTTNKTITDGEPFSGTITILTGVQVTFIPNGGTDIEPIVTTLGKPIGAIVCDRQDYVFEGWYTEETFANKWNLETEPVTQTMTLYAKWKANGIKTIENDNILVYPNPTQGSIKINTNQQKVNNINIFDISGKKLNINLETSFSADDVINIDISQLMNGVYFLKINVENGLVVKKIVKN